jgi:hypothetical protein
VAEVFVFSGKYDLAWNSAEALFRQVRRDETKLRGQRNHFPGATQNSRNREGLKPHAIGIGGRLGKS